jgi:hypothetical protein
MGAGQGRCLHEVHLEITAISCKDTTPNINIILDFATFIVISANSRFFAISFISIPLLNKSNITRCFLVSNVNFCE